MTKITIFSLEIGEQESDSEIYTRHSWSFRLKSLRSIHLLLICVFGAILLIGCIHWYRHGSSFSSSIERPFMNDTTLQSSYRLGFIGNMTRDAWKGYHRYLVGIHRLVDFLADRNTIVQALSSLWVMSLSDDFSVAVDFQRYLGKYNRSQYYALTSKNRTEDYYSFNEDTTGYIGSMLACYALTGEDWFLDEALNAKNDQKEGFTQSDRFELHILNHNSNIDWIGPHIEYYYMADLTNNRQLDKRNKNIRKILQKTFTIGENDDEKDEEKALRTLKYRFTLPLLSYLIKSYIQSNFTDQESSSLFDRAFDAMEEMGMIAQWTSGPRLLYVRDYDDFLLNRERMRAGGCNLGAILALSAWAKNQTKHDTVTVRRMEKHWMWAVQLTETCHHATSRTKYAVAPLWFEFAPNGTMNYFAYQKLTLHLAESYFVLYRLTRDPKYRQYAWELVQSIYKCCRSKRGTLHDADEDYLEKSIHHDYIMGATLKYLYLTFAEESLLSLDEWVFNRVGQPLPICGHNRMYPGDKCGSGMSVHLIHA